MARVKAPGSPAVTTPRGVFGSVLCGVDGSRADAEAARQAAILAGSGHVRLVSVVWSEGVGLDAAAALAPVRAGRALADAEDVARGLGATVSAEVIENRTEASALLAETGNHDLVVVGSHGHSRAGGIALGSVASTLVHRAPVSVLVARRPPDGARFPGDFLLATDGSESSEAAARLAARIAAAHPGRALVLRVENHDGGDEEARRRLAAEMAELFEASGTEPVVVTERGNPAAKIVEVAGEEQAALVVVGSRGLSGVRALGSVSERVAHRAPCSVLIARGET